MTTIFWLSLGLSAARWAWTEFQRWRDRGVIELQAEAIKAAARRTAALNDAVQREKQFGEELVKELQEEKRAKHNLLQRLESIKEVVG